MINTLLVRANVIRGDGIQAGDQQKLATIDSTILNVQEFIRSQAERGVLDPAGLERAREQSATLEKYFSRGEARDAQMQATFANLEALLARIAASNEATATNTVPQVPAATTALSSQQP